MRAVIDTNVLISGFISRESYPAKLVDGWVEKRFEPVVSEEIIREYREVFARDRFSALGSVKERLKLLGTLLSFEHVVLVNPRERICMVKTTLEMISFWNAPQLVNVSLSYQATNTCLN